MAMTIIPNCVLVKSKSARDNQQFERSFHRCALGTFNLAERLCFTTWKKLGAPVAQQIAGCYQEVVQ
jgi:hypothetical protein